MTDLTERLRDYATWHNIHAYVRDDIAEAATTLETLTQENARLREALGPFTQTTVLEPNGVIVGLERFHFERARKALGGGDE